MVGYVGIIIMLASIVLINMNIPTAKDSRKGLNKEDIMKIY